MGVALRKLIRSRVVVVFGATSRIGMATIEELSRQHQQRQQQRGGVSIAVVAAVENVKDPRAQRLKRTTGCFLVRCKFTEAASIQRAVRNADAVLLVPALSTSGTQFSKRVIDAVQAESVERLVIVSSILATNDFWRRERESSLPSSAPPSAATLQDLGYEAVEAHARSVLTNCVSLRIPLLMETIMYCREEIMFASRFYSCFDPDTVIPCIAVKDVAAAATRVLVEPTRKFNDTYCLAGAAVAITPREIEQRFSRALGKHVKYRQVTDAQLVAMLRESGATLYVAQSIVRLKNYLKPHERAAPATDNNDNNDNNDGNDDGDSVRVGGVDAPAPAPAPASVQDAAAAARREQVARLGFTNDFEQLVNRELMTPSKWLQQTVKHFARTPQNEMQLFVVGSGDGFFAELERFLAAQVTSATVVPAQDVGEAAIPMTTDGVAQAKVTFCAIKSVPNPAEPPRQENQTAQQQQQQWRWQRRGQSLPRTDSYFYQLPGGVLSPLGQLLKQLSSLDVMVYIPPLHLSPADRHEVTRVVVDAAAKANVWGIVVVSTLFTGLGSGAQLNDVGAMEQFIERSGVPFVIVRLPLFMEYFLALSSTDHVLAHAQGGSATFVTDTSSHEASSSMTRWGPPSTSAVAARPDDDTEEKPRAAEPQDDSDTLQLQQHGFTEEKGLARSKQEWNLLDRSLATSRQYLIAMADAAKVLAAIAFTFPLHRGRTRMLYTECLTMREIETTLQQCAYKGRMIAFEQVDALYEQPGREFWKVAHWPRTLTKEMLECSVALSAQPAPVAMAMDFEEVTECAPISLARWARANAKSYTHALEVSDES